MLPLCFGDHLRWLVSVLSAMTVSHNATYVTFEDCYDFETNTIAQLDPLFEYCDGDSWDIYYSINALVVPNAVIVQNQVSGVKVAYTTIPYEDIDSSDIPNLYYEIERTSRLFNQAVVVYTPEGNYYKVRFIKEDVFAYTCGPIGNGTPDAPFRMIAFPTPTVVFEWEQIADD
jgi:hypothetical protein